MDERRTSSMTQLSQLSQLHTIDEETSRMGESESIIFPSGNDTISSSYHNNNNNVDNNHHNYNSVVIEVATLQRHKKHKSGSSRGGNKKDSNKDVSNHTRNSKKPTRSKSVTAANNNAKPSNPVRINSSESAAAIVVQKPSKVNKQWLTDRIRGNSRYNPDIGRPPSFLCWVPPPVGRFSTLLEQNWPCRFISRVGCFDPESVGMRRFVFGNALVANLIGFALTLFATFGISDRYSLLTKASFSRGIVEISKASNQPPIRVDIGLRSIAFRNDFLFNTTVMRFDDLCNAVQDNTGFVLYPERCTDCVEASEGLVSACILSLLSYIPTIFTNILRMYPNYDVNCQKSFGIVIGTLSLLLSMYTWRGYRESCFQGFANGQVSVTQSLGRATSVEDTYYIFDFTWTAGNGMLCIVTATILKMIDVICNLIIPTPTITRNLDEQAEYEQLSIRNCEQHQFDDLHERFRDPTCRHPIATSGVVQPI